MMKTRKIIPIGIILLFVAIIVLYFKSFKNTENKNPFFFQHDLGTVNYNGDFMFWGDNIQQTASLSIIKIKKLKNGTLYELKLDSLNVKDEFEQIPKNRRNLGFFYVTETKIYRIPPFDRKPPFTDSFTDFHEQITKDMWDDEDNLIDSSQLVCQDLVLSDLLGGEDNKGWHELVEVDGDKRRFRSFDNYGKTGFYERFVWEKNKGLVYYRSGFGARRESIEIWLYDREE